MNPLEHLKLTTLNQSVQQHTRECIDLIKYSLFKDTKIISNYAKEDLGTLYTTMDEALSFNNNKFYLNIRGLPHPSNTQGIRFYSYDTKTYELFTLETFRLHPKSIFKYTPGSAPYFKLLEAYPDDELYIRGVLNPISEARAYEIFLDAPDGTIIAYPKQFLEPYEVTLIADLQRWCIDYYNRWDVQAFNLSDSYYTVAQNALFFMNAVLKVIALRLERAKTFEAHSFHIKRYFASHYGLDRYYDYLFRNQVIYLYKNLRRLRNHAGFQDTFTEVLKKIAEPRAVPVLLAHTIANNTLDNEARPIIEHQRVLISPGTNYNINANDIYSYAHFRKRIEDKQTVKYLYPSHLEYRDLQNSKFNHHLTKFLESDMVDENGSYGLTLEEYLIFHWAYYAQTGRYNIEIYFNNNLDSRTYSLTTKDAFIYYYYIALKYLDLDYNNLISVNVPLVNLDESELTAERINWHIEPLHHFDSHYVQKVTDSILLNYGFSADSYAENLDFYNDLKPLFFNNFFGLKLLIANTHDAYNNGLVKRMMLNCFDYRIVNYDIPDLDAWVESKQLPKVTYKTSKGQLEATLGNLVKEATGLKYGEMFRLSNIQRNMIQLMEHFLSYKVRFIYDALENPIHPIAQATRLHYEIQDLHTTHFYPTAAELNDPKASFHINKEMFKYENDFLIQPGLSIDLYCNLANTNTYSSTSWKQEIAITTAAEVQDNGGVGQTSNYLVNLKHTVHYIKGKSLYTDLFNEVMTGVQTGITHMRVKDRIIPLSVDHVIEGHLSTAHDYQVSNSTIMVTDSPVVLPADLKHVLSLF